MKKYILLSLLFLVQSIYAQNIQIDRIKNSDTRPRIEWYRPGNDSLYRDFKVWRAHVDSRDYDTIATGHFIMVKSNRVKYIVIDTTLTKKGIFKYYIEVKDKDQNILKSPVALAHNMGHIPKPHLVAISAEEVQDKKAIKLHWKLNHNFSVRSLSLFRSSFGDKNYEKIAELSGKATEYTDMVSLSNHNYYYFILIADYFGYEQPSPIYPAFSLFKQKPLPPQNIKLSKSENNIKLYWRNVENNLSGYQVFRKKDDNKFMAITEILNSNDINIEYIDTNIPRKTHKLSYYVVNYSDSYMPSVSSDTLDIFMPNLQKPLPPEQVDILEQADGRQKLIWTVSKIENIKGFNVYMEKPKQEKLNKELIPFTKNYFVIDKFFTQGSYTLSVESVGFDNTTSTYKSNASKNILRAYANLVVNIIKQKEGIALNWLQYPDDAIKEIQLYRQNGEQSPVLLQKFPNKITNYLDKDVKSNSHYFYTLYAVLNNGNTIPINQGIDITY